MVTESDTFVQAKFIRPCLDLNLQHHQREASSLPQCYPAFRNDTSTPVTNDKLQHVS